MTILGNSDDDKKEDTMMDLQTRLVTDDALANAAYVQHDEEAQQSNVLVIQVMDEVAQKGEKQPNQFRDAPFGFLFILHLLLVSFFACAWGLPALFAATSSSENDNTPSTSFSGVLGLCLLSSLACVFIIAGTLSFLIHHADIVIQFSLVLSTVMTFLMALVFAVKLFIWFAIFYFVLGALGAWYACSVWSRIPFAKANLKVATTSIRSNLGVVGVGFGLVAVFVVWVCLWMLSFAGIYMHTRKCDSTTGECDDGAMGQITGIVYLLSFYWTVQVIKNILVVTVAGTVGTWWFAPDEANAFCSVAITDSLSRASTYSFGSICLGSLLMAIIQVLNHMIHNARRNQRDSMLLAVLECLANLLERIAEYFNKYACIYVGLYGYDYVTAGKRVLELFRERGWDTIINDQLVYRVLTLMSFVVGGLTGIAGMIIASMAPSWMEAFGDDRYSAAFLLPFLIGTGVAHVVLGIIASATDTVLVCFAESPNEFQSNYPQLSQEMLTAWRQIYPEEFGL
ncbi:Protein PNS1 [Seminavis robusta]|uniref:Choline transporter-like protein n=1 Tax=Seminavis robusta TaxID=568900 RepID=A0A9N8DTG4_9STRA|nr:Protein PNS1 [Seminavis robusta]|eukprot:Sro358_g125800.1 Protein PNS1 (511) ;mRNA; f:16560-18264